MCPHARPDWHVCPRCNGVNEYARQQHAADRAATVPVWPRGDANVIVEDVPPLKFVPVAK